MQFLKAKFKEALRKTEHYTKTDMVYLTREGFWSLLGQVIGSACSFLVAVLLANILSKESFGEYRFVLSMIPVLALFALPGINTAFVRSVARGNGTDLPKMVNTEIRWGFLGSLVALLIASYYFLNGDTGFFFALVLTAVFLPFLEPFSIYAAYYKGKQNFKTPMIYESASRVFQTVALIVVGLITKSVPALVGAFLVGQIVARLFFYIKTLRNEKLSASRESTDENQSDDTIKYGKQLTATQIVGTVTGSIDKLVVGYFLGPEILAIYYVALAIPKNIVLMFNVVPRIAFPRFSKNTWEPRERARIIYKLLVFLGALIVPALLYFFLIPFALPLVFKDYGASIPAALILSALILLSPLNATIGQVLQARKLVKNMIFLQVIALAAFVAAFLVMYQRFGASPIDAAAAIIASEAVLLFAGMFFIK